MQAVERLAKLADPPIGEDTRTQSHGHKTSCLLRLCSCNVLPSACRCLHYYFHCVGMCTN